MNIGEASKASGVSAKMIRYYEKIGLIPPADRTDSGYRAYVQADLHRLHFIRRARDLGFLVTEISDLLGLWSDQMRQSANVKRLANQHIVELGQRIENMRQMEKTLQALINSCSGDQRPDCPILHELQQPDVLPLSANERTGAMSRRTRGKAAISTEKRNWPHGVAK